MQLSRREQQLILLAAVAGMTDKAIAQKLKIDIATVRDYWGRIREKLGAVSRTQAVFRYFLLNPDLLVRLAMRR